MEVKKFSSSRGVVIYVKDFLERYSADALRYYILAAGPESQDSDFTWQDFLNRNNNELVAGWGNLVNRVANMIAKNFGAIPQAQLSDAVDLELLDAVQQSFTEVGDLIEGHRQKQALAALMRVVQKVNTYISETEPFKLKGDVLGSEVATAERLKQILFTCAQAVVDINTMFACLLPHSANKVYQIFGGAQGIDGGQGPRSAAPLPVRQTVADLDPEHALVAEYPIITGEYNSNTILEWRHHPLVPGTPVSKPDIVFTKLDEAIVSEELDRMTGAK